LPPDLDDFYDVYTRNLHQGLAFIRSKLPSYFLPVFDQYVNLLGFTENTVDRFIDLMESFQFNPPDDLIEALRRVAHAARPVEAIIPEVEVSISETNIPVIDPVAPPVPASTSEYVRRRDPRSGRGPGWAGFGPFQPRDEL